VGKKTARFSGEAMTHTDPETPTKKFQTWLRQVMLKKGLTQAQLGEMVGVTQVAVGRWLKGTNGPDASVLVKLAQVTDTSPIWLMQLLGILPAEPPAEPNSGKTARDYAVEKLADKIQSLPPEVREKTLRAIEAFMDIYS
jgi:transcriptional regulator with XRE-family HTH domain